MGKIFLVQENVRTRHIDETFSTIAACTTKKAAEGIILAQKEAVNQEWADYIDEDWEVESDTPTCYEIHDDDYDTLYNVWVEEIELR